MMDDDDDAFQLARSVKSSLSQFDTQLPGDALSKTDLVQEFLTRSSVAGAPIRMRGYSNGSSRHSIKREDDDDDDLETVLDIKETKKEWDPSGSVAYERACKMYGVKPAQTFKRRLKSEERIDLSYYGLGPMGAKAIAVALVINTRVAELILKGNQLGLEGTSYFSEMMIENFNITEVDLSDNNLKGGGGVVADLLRNNATLQKLSASENDFTDADALEIADVVEGHQHLAYLDLSKNGFTSEAGAIFKKMISENGVLAELNLGWNKIRGDGAVALAEALAENVGLKVIDLSWNGFDRASGLKVADAIRVNRTLTEINLFSNRVESVALVAMCKAIEENDNLENLKVGQNPISQEAATTGLLLLKEISDLKLQVLDFSELIYTPAFGLVIAEVTEVHEEFKVIYGYTDSYGKRKLRSYDVVSEALSFFQQYCVENNINLIQLFEAMDEDGSQSVSYDEFKEGLRAAKIPLSNQQIEHLIQALDADGDGDIDFSELVLGAEEHKQ